MLLVFAWLLIGQPAAGAPPNPLTSQHVFLSRELPVAGPYAKYADWVSRDFPSNLTQALFQQGFAISESAADCVHCLWLSARVDFRGSEWEKRGKARLVASSRTKTIATCEVETQSFDNWQVGVGLAVCLASRPEVLAYAREPQVDPAPVQPETRKAEPPPLPPTAKKTALALQKPAKMVVLPLRALRGISPDLAKLLTSLLLSELEQVSGLRTVGQSDIEAMLGVEKQKEMLGCSTTSCIAEIGGALGADFVLHGEIGKIGSKHTFNVTVIRSANNAVTTRLSRLTASEDGIADELPGAVASLVDALNKPK